MKFPGALMAAGLLGWGAAAHGADAPAPAGKPNILYILADDLGYADVGFNGCKDIKTPHLDKLAQSGAVLGSYYVQPLCSPTRAALMTGRYAVRTGVYEVVRPNAPWGLKLEERTLAQALREAGYETAIVGKWHLGEFQPAYRPTQRGFDHQYGLWFGMIEYFAHKRDGQLDWHRDDQPCKDQGYTTHLLAQEACRLIRERKQGKPLFLYLPFNAVHAPYEVPPKYLEPYAGIQGTRRVYAAMVAAMDEAVGQVLAALEEKGMRENTLIVFSSDNGGPDPRKVTSNGPLRGAKGGIYEGGIRVCACVNWPGHVPAGAVIQEPVHAVDWYPTLVKLAGGSLQQKLPVDGLDILPVLTRGAKSPHEYLLLCGVRRGQAAIRKGDWKLIVDGGDGPGRGAELYNLAKDPGERLNLAGGQSDMVAGMKAIYETAMKGAVPSGAGKGSAGE